MKAILLAAVLGFGVPSGTSYIDSGITALDAGDYECSIELFEKALATKDLTRDSQVAALMDEGHAYHLLGKYEDSIRKFTAVTMIAPDHAQAYIGRASAYFLGGEIDNAIADYSAVLKRTSDDKSLRITAFVGRAGGYFRESKIDLSLRDYASALEIDPRADLPRFLRGTVYWRLGRFRDAAQDFSDLLRADPTSARDALWWIISADPIHRKLGALSEVNPSKIDATRWPGILVQFYNRAATEEQVFVQAEERDGHARNWTEHIYECDARFFVGEWHLLTGDINTVASSLAEASTQCSPAFVLYGASKAELARATAMKMSGY